jgi:hypothetical protein
MIADLTFDQYRAVDAVNFSTLRFMDASAAHYLHAITTPRSETAAMREGRAAHCAVLEPDAFQGRYEVYDGERRGNAWKEFAATAAAAGREVLTRTEHDKATAIREAVRGCDDAAFYLSDLEARTEVSVTWADAATGLDCKARLDWLGRAGKPFYVDLKTSKETEAGAFGRTAARLLYHGQLAMQGMGLAANDIGGYGAVIVAVENEPPHDVAVFELSDDDLYAGETKVAELLARVAECRRTGAWPGRYAGPQPLRLPSWALDLSDDIEVIAR